MDGDDRLSALSDDLLRRILHFVPSKESASTSVLSRRWGSLWRSSGAVNLSVRVKERSSYSYQYYELSSAREAADDAFFSCQESFAAAAAAALAAAEAPVSRLTLRVDTDGNDSVIEQFLQHSRDRCTYYGDMVGDVVGDVLSHDAARHVEHLRVALVERLDACRFFSDREIGQNAGIHSLFFLPSAETLRVLDLTRCECDLAPPALATLTRLATLRLRLCSIQPDDLQALLDAAPDLATVHLESVFFKLNRNLSPVHAYQSNHYHQVHVDVNATAEPPVVGLSFRAVTTLVLALCGREGQGGHVNGWAIEVDAPRLRSFVYKGLLRRFLLRSAAPDLARVDLHFLEDQEYRCRRHYDDDYDKERVRVLFWQFVHNFTSARAFKLKVDYDLKDIAATGEARRAKLLCAFPNVVHLELEGVHWPTSKTAAVAIANLLHCCPVVRDLMLNLSTTVLSQSQKGSNYGWSFLGRKDKLDYNKSLDRFMRRTSKTRNTMEDSSGDGDNDDVPDIPGLSGRSFACLQSSLRRVSLQFRLDNSSSSCLGVRLVKFFANNAKVLEEMCVDSGNRRLYEHLKLNVERWATSNLTKACFQHKDPVEGSWEFSRIPIASLDSTTDVERSTTCFTVLPLQRRTRIDRES
ncbi:unnamed protein product [Urochloa decumbens]|uniref:F-box domain-containing protein n=1 Tax=Urochloa decumbens TaxID=240449 RepID=A0ABC8W0D4_9POAL